MNRATQEYIRKHANDDVRQLALRPVPADVELHVALQQIEGRQLAARKLPACAATDGFLFPPRLSMEQCSSETTAMYKRHVVRRLLEAMPPTKWGGEGPIFCDLTGGLGIDFMAIAPLFKQAVYVERNVDLCNLARNNLPLMGCTHAEVVCGDASDFLLPVTFQFIDPARRDDAGRKVARIEDCTPDVCALQEQLRKYSVYTIIKLSPMLDITAALRSLQGIAEVHVVCVEGECKELLLVMGPSRRRGVIPICCADIEAMLPLNIISEFRFTLQQEKDTPLVIGDWDGGLPPFLYEPNAGIMKAGAYKSVCRRYPVQKLARHSHLYGAEEHLANFPGRQWRVLDHATFSKKDLKRLLEGIDAADLTVRGFPMSVANLRKQLHLKEGGNAHFIATTLADNQKVLIRVERL